MLHLQAGAAVEAVGACRLHRSVAIPGKKQLLLVSRNTGRRVEMELSDPFSPCVCDGDTQMQNVLMLSVHQQKKHQHK